jgi:hypothetical protein
MAVTFALALASHASGQEDWQRMVRNCYESRLINKEFYKANKDVMPDAAGRIPRLYLLSAMIAQISEVSEDYTKFDPGLYQIPARPSQSNTNLPGFYLKHKETTWDVIRALRKAGIVNEDSETLLLKEMNQYRLVHPYYALCAAALCVIREEYHSRETLLAMVDYFSGDLKKNEAEALRQQILSGRGNLYAILEKLDNYKPVTLYKIDTAEELMSFIKQRTVFVSAHLNAYDPKLEVVMDSIQSCSGYSFVSKKYVFTFKYHKFPISFECPTDWSSDPPKIRKMDLYSSEPFLNFLTQGWNDWSLNPSARIVFVDAFHITSHYLDMFAIEDISDRLLHINSFHGTTKGWWPVPRAKYATLKERPLQLSNGLAFPIIQPGNYGDEEFLTSRKKWAIYSVIDSSGALHGRPQSTVNQLVRGFSTALITDTLSALNQLGLAAVPFNECFETIPAFYKENPGQEIGLFQFMRCISFNEFVIPDSRNEMGEHGKLNRTHMTFPGSDQTYSFTYGNGNFCYELMMHTARAWKKNSGKKRQFHYIPGTSAVMPYIMYVTPEEAYRLQEGLNYLIRAY